MYMHRDSINLSLFSNVWKDVLLIIKKKTFFSDSLAKVRGIGSHSRHCNFNELSDKREIKK